MTIRKIQFAWKYRKPLWRYRKLLAHRHEIAGAAIAAVVIAGSALALVFSRKSTPVEAVAE